MKVDEIWVCVAGKAVDSLITKQHSDKGGSTGGKKKTTHKYFKLNAGETLEEWERASNLQTRGDSAFQAKIKNCGCGGQKLSMVWECPSVNPNSGKVLLLHQKEQSYQFFFS